MNWRTTVRVQHTAGEHTASVGRYGGTVQIGAENPSRSHALATIGLAEAKRLHRDLGKIIREIEADNAAKATP